MALLPHAPVHRCLTQAIDPPEGAFYRQKDGSGISHLDLIAVSSIDGRVSNPEEGMAPETTQLLVWAFNAFWLWLGLALLLKRAGLPLPQIGAAVLGWVGAGALLPWTLPLAEHWLKLWPDAFHRVLAFL